MEPDAGGLLGMWPGPPRRMPHPCTATTGFMEYLVLRILGIACPGSARGLAKTLGPKGLGRGGLGSCGSSSL